MVTLDKQLELEAQMYMFCLDALQENINHAKQKRQFTKKFGLAATKKHWDEMVTFTWGE